LQAAELAAGIQKIASTWSGCQAANFVITASNNADETMRSVHACSGCSGALLNHPDLLSAQ
jgi:hypothetical protein